MKATPILLFLAVLLVSCTSAPPVKNKFNEKIAICFQAIDQNDTAWLRLDTADQVIIGDMQFNYHNKNYYNGQVKGEMRGDTLNGSYTFRLNKVDKWYRNPIALLKKDGEWQMGVGQIMTMWGTGFFKEDEPIDFERGRFVFKQIGCPIKTKS